MNKKLPWPEKKEDLTIVEAVFIKYLRVEGYNWRALSEAFCVELYPKAKSWPDCAGSQLHGRDLCRYAAEYLGENPNERPWN